MDSLAGEESGKAGAGCVIIGAGLAAAHAVQSLRERNYRGAIILIGEEPERPYERPPLSKEYLQGSKPREEVFVHAADWYEQHRVTTRFGTRVESIDTEAKKVRLSGGEELDYEALILATGSRPRIPGKMPGAKLPGVHYLRTLADSEALREQFKPGARLAIVGSGWIGLEIAASARQAGVEVTVVAPEHLPLERILGETIGGYLAELHRRNGVDLHLGTSVEGIIERNGRAAGLHTSAGDVEADLVLVAIGAMPNTELAEAAGLEIDNGVVVDSRLRTLDSSVFAIGDVANAWNTLRGERLRVEHWDNAIRQGKLVAGSILEGIEDYAWQPYFFTDQFDLGMEYVGRSAPSDEVLIRGNLADGAFIAFWLADGVISAAMNVNTWDVNDALRALVGKAIPAGRLTDLAIGLEELNDGI
ncbi:NAD(P)/FAD-dependent oxidoreductase [Paeniglutamicibacter cryotolerans]|uniref:3-phenylpropionate/trans-cinnamate dioxygenase ferredoxin reductase subunit n=1 Tax=Paeniglutamicibacter cryotolerans TaxID=670079 RepID=A0A839QEL2_9MICC|nr:FAD-dependent oxidoreductase [Paeniglutamicibacter cryotolerans]MBB2994589.1 3-phenylpropionate/trans-cinnamate dioxygenase ferredoxin reductase subunit [Paeniglutamicibacter cryotolerans]